MQMFIYFIRDMYNSNQKCFKKTRFSQICNRSQKGSRIHGYFSVVTVGTEPCCTHVHLQDADSAPIAILFVVIFCFVRARSNLPAF